MLFSYFDFPLSCTSIFVAGLHFFTMFLSLLTNHKTPLLCQRNLFIHFATCSIFLYFPIGVPYVDLHTSTIGVPYVDLYTSTISLLLFTNAISMTLFCMK
ncbi:hypothetical protein VPH35_090037 [Triticum aestivum]